MRHHKLLSKLPIQPNIFCSLDDWRESIPLGAMDYANQAPWVMPAGAMLAGQMQAVIYREQTIDQA